MKNPCLKILLILSLPLVLTFAACNNDNYSTTPGPTNKGAYILCESIPPAAGDYSLINLETDSVSNNLFQNSNPGMTLGVRPEGLLMYQNLELYIVTQGSPGTNGKMYHLYAQSTRILDTVTFGSNPYNFTIVLGKIYCTNISSDFVTKLDLNLNIITNSIQVGPNPADITFGHYFVYVAKSANTTENSLAIIDAYHSDQVTKAFFNAPPVSAAANYDNVFISGFTDKKIYRMDTLVSNKVIDTLYINTSYDAVGQIAAGDLRTMYFVLMSGSDGKAIYKFDILTKTVSPVITEDPSLINIYGFGYEPETRTLFILDSKDGSQNGQVRKYDDSGQLIKIYDIGGKFPRRIAFRY